MTTKNWTVTYTDRGNKVSSTVITWPSEPSVHHAAIAIRDRLLPNDFLLPDMSRNSTESAAVHLLRSYGFEITNIEELPADATGAQES